MLLDCFPDGKEDNPSLWASQQLVLDNELAILTVINHQTPRAKWVRIPAHELGMADGAYDVVNLRSGKTELANVRRHTLASGFKRDMQPWEVFAAVIVPSGGAPPEVWIDSHRSTQGSVAVRGRAADDRSVYRVDYQLDGQYPGQWLVAEGGDEWRIEIDAAKFERGRRTLYVRAVDNHFNWSEVRSVSIGP